MTYSLSEIREKAAKFRGFKSYSDLHYWGKGSDINEVNLMVEFLQNFQNNLLNRNAVELPDEHSHPWGWEARKIDGKWRVGMKGNLDTIHDATLTVHAHGFPIEDKDSEDAKVAIWIAYQYNMCLEDLKKNGPKIKGSR